MNNIVHISLEDRNKTNPASGNFPTGVDRLIIDVVASANDIHHALKPGLPRCVYQLKLYNDLLKKGFQSQTEMSALNIAVTQEADRELIIVNEVLVIECIVETDINDRCHKKIMFDLENNGYEKGLLINFSDPVQCDVIKRKSHAPMFH